MEELDSQKAKSVKILSKIGSTREIIIFSIAVAMFITFFFTTNGNIFLPESLNIISVAVSELGLIAIGITILMIAGEFDLSVGSVSALGAMIVTKFYGFGMNPFLAFFIALVIGAILGSINGLITVKFNLPSFIVTMGTMIAWRGVVYVVTAGVPISFCIDDTNPAFSNFMAGKLGVMPTPIIWLIILTVILVLILNFHKFGNHVYAVGGNKETARAMGINTDKVKVICFMLVGILSTIVGVMRVTRVRGLHALQGEGIELLVIAATVIGGTLLTGGVGTVIGAVFGALVITLIEYGLIMSGIGAYIYKIVLGAIIVVVAILNNVFERKRK